MAQAARQRAQEQSQRPGFLFLSCPDSQILLEEVEARARAWAPQDGPFKRLCFWGDEPPDNSFWEALNLRDLFGSVRLVVVRQAHLWHADVWKLLDKMLARPLTGSFPIFCLENAQDGDIVVLAGKGHEDYQEIQGVKHPFDERVVVAELLKEMGKE